jgi:hypothetical protein
MLFLYYVKQNFEDCTGWESILKFQRFQGECKKIRFELARRARGELAADACGRRRHSKAEIKRMVFNLPEGHDNHCGDR